MSDPYIGVIGTLVGAIIGFIGSYFASSILFNKQRIREETSKFREAFIEEIILCEKDIIPDQGGILDVVERNILTQEKAIIRFRAFVNGGSIDAFNEASHEYTDYYKRVEVCAMPKPGIETENIYIKTPEEERREIILSKINKLLEYAPIK